MSPTRRIAVMLTREKSASGRSIELVDLRTISPLDTETIVESVNKTGRAVIVHEAPKTCGFGAELSASVAEDAMLHLKGPIMRVTGYDVVMPLPRLEEHYLPTRDRIRGAIEEVVKY